MRALVIAVAALGTACAHAGSWSPDGVSLRYGKGKWDDSRVAGVGMVWDWSWKVQSGGLEATAFTEATLNRWQSTSVAGDRQAVTQVAALPVLRVQPAGGWPVFFDIGIGLSWQDSLPRSRWSRFSTHWNFFDAVGVGVKLGARQQHEVGVRYEHTSNAGFKLPNPGQDFLQLRYVARF